MMYISPIDGRGACDACSGIYPKGHKDQLARMIFELSDRLNQKVVFFYGRVDEKNSFLSGFIHDFVGAIGISARICRNYNQD